MLILDFALTYQWLPTPAEHQRVGETNFLKLPNRQKCKPQARPRANTRYCPAKQCKLQHKTNLSEITLPPPKKKQKNERYIRTVWAGDGVFTFKDKKSYIHAVAER